MQNDHYGEREKRLVLAGAHRPKRVSRGVTCKDVQEKEEKRERKGTGGHHPAGSKPVTDLTGLPLPSPIERQ